MCGLAIISPRARLRFAHAGKIQTVRDQLKKSRNHQNYPKREFSSGGRPVAGPVIVHGKEQTIDTPDSPEVREDWPKGTLLFPNFGECP